MQLALPQGYRAALAGSGSSIEQMSFVAPAEEQAAEGTLMLMELHFAEQVDEDVLIQLETDLLAAGVEKWPSYDRLVYTGEDSTVVFVAWQKGIPWMGIIVGILVLTLLPALLGWLIWAILPQSIKDIINAMIMMGVVILMMKLMGGMMSEGKKEPKKIKKPAEIEFREYEVSSA